jgi:hypothetical protein
MIKALRELLNGLALVDRPRQDKQRIKMENCKKSDLILSVRKRNVGRFKAGAELSGKVSMMEVDFNEEVYDTSEMIEVKIKLSSESCEAAPGCEA